MKVLLIVGLFFISTQAEEPGERLAQTAAAIRDCVLEKKLDGGKYLGIMTKGEKLPEDDEEFLGFFSCYYKKLGLFKDDEHLDEGLIRSLLPELLKQKFKLSDADAKKIAGDASKACEGVEKDKRDIVTAVRARNCATDYVKKHIPAQA